MKHSIWWVKLPDYRYEFELIF